jgi:hypothetical protein
MLILENKKIKNEKGMAAVFFVILITAASLIMIKSVGMINLDILEATDIINNGQRIEYLAESCAANYLLKIRDNKNYQVVNDVIVLEEGSCEVNVNKNVSLTEIDIIFNMGDYNKRLKIEVDLSGEELVINEWNFINI